MQSHSVIFVASHWRLTRIRGGCMGAYFEAGVTKQRKYRV